MALISCGPLSSLERETKLRPLFTLSIKREIRDFHAVVVQKRQRNVQIARCTCKLVVFLNKPVAIYSDYIRHIHHAFIIIFETRHTGLIMTSLNVLVKLLPSSPFRLSPCFFIGVRPFFSASCLYFHFPQFLGLYSR